MNSTDMQAVFAKVQKLRRLATSSNVHEASNAARAVEKLIQEHRLHEAEIESHADPATHEKPIKGDTPIQFGVRVQGWMWRLALGLTRHYDCACYFNRRRAYGEGTRLHLIGRKADIETVNYQFAYFCAEITRLAKRHPGAGRARANSFRIGAVDGLLSAIADVKKASTATAVGSTAMVLSSRYDEAHAAMQASVPNLRKGGGPSVGRVSDGSGYDAGRRAGRELGQSSGRGKLDGGGGGLLGTGGR